MIHTKNDSFSICDVLWELELSLLILINNFIINKKISIMFILLSIELSILLIMFGL